MNEELSLDDLFQQAKSAMQSQQAKKRNAAEKLAPEAPVKVDPLAVWKNPANWVRARGIALIHQETQTLLGNFTEYTHRTVESARKLIREANPLPTQSVEYMSGDFWLPEEHKTPKRAWKTQLDTVLPLRLCSLHMQAPSVSIRAMFGEGDLICVELLEQTVFTADDHSLMILPAGLSILSELAPSEIHALLTKLDQPI